jgi:hypothetical protein
VEAERAVQQNVPRPRRIEGFVRDRVERHAGPVHPRPRERRELGRREPPARDFDITVRDVALRFIVFPDLVIVLQLVTGEPCSLENALLVQWIPVPRGPLNTTSGRSFTAVTGWGPS